MQSETASRVVKLRQRSSAETPLAEEPDARIAHVRICGGPGWATAGPTWPNDFPELRIAAQWLMTLVKLHLSKEVDIISI